MVIPVGRPTRAAARVGADVNHSFWVPDFLSKRDLIPGVDNEIDDHAHGDRPVRRPLRRVLRPRPLAHELLGAGRVPRTSTTTGSTTSGPSDARRPGRARSTDGRLGDPLVTTSTNARSSPRSRREPEHRAQGLLAFLTSTDHKRIGISYMATAFAFYLVGGALAVVIRSELAEPGRTGGVPGPLQRDVHHAREHHVVPVPGPVRLRPGELPRAVADRRPRHGVPAAQRPVVLVLPVRRHHDADAGSSPPTGRADFGWTGYTPLSSVVRVTGHRRRPVDRRRSRSPGCRASSPGSTSSPRS